MTRAGSTARACSGAIVAGVAVVLAGCTGVRGADASVYDAARAQNLAFKSAAATVLVHLYDGDWQVQEYGDLPERCDGGYAFSMHRTTPEGWTLDEDAAATAHRLARWLSDRGWVAREDATATGDRAAVAASDPALGVESLVVEVRDGPASADAIGVGATSVCFDGDAEQLAALLYPGYPGDPVAHDPLPVAEPAGATPVFGFTDDGRPR